MDIEAYQVDDAEGCESVHQGVMCSDFARRRAGAIRSCRQLLLQAVLLGIVTTLSLLAVAQDSDSPSRASTDTASEREVLMPSQKIDGSEARARQNLSTTERLSDRAEMDRIIELYMAGSYQQCSTELGEFLDPKNPVGFSDRVVLERARLYFASCSLLDGRRDAARKALQIALEQNPLMASPDSLTFPPPLVSLFLEVRGTVQQLIADREKEQVIRQRKENEMAKQKTNWRAYRERELEKLARQESIVAKNSRALATIPFGVGQFQNGNNTLGAIVLATEGVLLGTVITSAFILKSLTNGVGVKSDKGEDGGAGSSTGIPDDIPGYNNDRNAAYRTLNWSSWALLGACVVGIAEAHINFKSERRLGTRPRSLPGELEYTGKARRSPALPKDSHVEVRPMFSGGPIGGYLSIAGKF